MVYTETNGGSIGGEKNKINTAIHTEINTRNMQNLITRHKGSSPASESTTPTARRGLASEACGNAQAVHRHADHLVFREEGLQGVQVKQRQ